MIDVMTVPFDPRAVPYEYTLVLGGRRFIFRWEWNFVAGWFRLVVMDPVTREVLWTRPVLWGTDILWGCTVPVLGDYALVPGDPAGALANVGITWHNAHMTKMYLFRKR